MFSRNAPIKSKLRCGAFKEICRLKPTKRSTLCGGKYKPKFRIVQGMGYLEQAAIVLKHRDDTPYPMHKGDSRRQGGPNDPHLGD